MLNHEVNIGGMAVEAEFSHQYFVQFCFCVTDGRGTPDKMASDIELCMRQR